MNVIENIVLNATESNVDLAYNANILNVSSCRIKRTNIQRSCQLPCGKAKKEIELLKNVITLLLTI